MTHLSGHQSLSPMPFSTTTFFFISQKVFYCKQCARRNNVLRSSWEQRNRRLPSPINSRLRKQRGGGGGVDREFVRKFLRRRCRRCPDADATTRRFTLLRATGRETLGLLTREESSETKVNVYRISLVNCMLEKINSKYKLINSHNFYQLSVIIKIIIKKNI